MVLCPLSKYSTGEMFNLHSLHTFFFICHIYLPSTRKQIVLLDFGREVCTHLGVAISVVSGPPVFHIKVGASHLVPCPRKQQVNLPACSPQPSLKEECQAGKLWIPFFKSFVMTRQED